MSPPDENDEPRELADVSIRLLGFQATPKAGSLICLLDAEVVFSGGEILELYGLQIRAEPQKARISLGAPHYRTRGGEWRPAVRLDDAIWTAILNLFREQVPDPEQLTIDTAPPAIFFNAVATSAR